SCPSAAAKRATSCSVTGDTTARVASEDGVCQVPSMNSLSGCWMETQGVLWRGSNMLAPRRVGIPSAWYRVCDSRCIAVQHDTSSTVVDNLGSQIHHAGQTKEVRHAFPASPGHPAGA